MLHTEPHPHPPADAVPEESEGRAGEASVLSLVASELAVRCNEVDEADAEGSDETGPPPSLTRSVLFLIVDVGVPERVGRVGSALFCVISSMKARTSASLVLGFELADDADAAAGGGVAVDLVGSGAAKESRSSRNSRASSCLDLDLLAIGMVELRSDDEGSDSD